MKRLFALLLPVALAISALAATNAWQHLPDCQFIPNSNNDGDSFHVRFGSTNLVVRLNFVDAPESSLTFESRVKDQAKYFGITVEDAVKVGKDASNFVRSKLESNRFEVATRWQPAAGSAKDRRYYCFVHVGGFDLAEMLVSNGLARVYGAKTTDVETGRNVTDKLKALEADARAAKRGAWALAGTNTVVDALAETGWRVSASGVRHNAKCRYYDSPSNKPCKATDGKACKVCGG